MAHKFADLLADRFTFHAVNISRFEGSLQTQTLELLRGLETKIEAEMARLDPTATLYRRRRLAALQKSVRANIQSAYRDIRTDSRRSLVQLAETVADGTLETVNAAARVALLNVGLPKETLRALTDDSLIQGAPAREWWSRQAGGLYQKFSTEIREGMYRGETLQQLTGRIIGTKEFNYQNGIMAAARHNAESLIRTSVQSVSQAARLDTLRANADVIKGYQALATLDARTTPLCQARSGMAWFLDGRPMEGTPIDFPGPPPWHYNCRTNLIPITYSYQELAKNKDLGKKVQAEVDKLPKGTQASMDGQVAADLNYEQWLKGKDDTFQKAILGQQKWQLWKDNKLSLRQLIDQKGRPLTIQELREHIAKVPPAASAWQPSMTVDQADRWSQGTALPDNLYHHTSPDAAASIEQGGFIVGNGSVYGRGVYLTTSQDPLITGARGVSLTGKGAVLTTRVNVKKVFELPGSVTTPTRFFQALQKMGATVDELQDASAFLQSRGYDAVRIKRGVGKPDFYTILNPRNVTTVKPPTAPIQPKPVLPKPTPPPEPAPPPRPTTKPWTAKTIGREWHDVAFQDSDPLTHRAIQHLPGLRISRGPTAEEAAKRQVSYYRMGSREIMMQAKYQTTSRDGQAVWRHEYGHHVDAMLGKQAKGYTRFITSTDEWKAIWRDDGIRALQNGKGRFPEAVAARDATTRKAQGWVDEVTKVANREGDAAAMRRIRDIVEAEGLTWSEWERFMDESVTPAMRTLVTKDSWRRAHLEVLAAYRDGVLTEGLFRHFASARASMAGVTIMDTLGAATKNAIGYGHKPEYYRGRSGTTNQGTEIFANIYAMLANPNPMWGRFAARFMPRMTAKIRETLEALGG